MATVRAVADGRLVFYRLWTWQDAVRSYKIEVDGVEVAVLKPRSSVCVTLAVGVRACRARIAWTGSEPTGIEVLANQEVRVLVGDMSARRRLVEFSSRGSLTEPTLGAGPPLLLV